MKIAAAAVLTTCMALSPVALANGDAMQAAKPTNYKGLEVTPLGIERAKNVPAARLPARALTRSAATRVAAKSSRSSRSLSK